MAGMPGRHELDEWCRRRREKKRRMLARRWIRNQLERTKGGRLVTFPFRVQQCIEAHRHVLNNETELLSLIADGAMSEQAANEIRSASGPRDLKAVNKQLEGLVRLAQSLADPRN